MSDLQGQLGEIRMKLQVKRKETGLVEDYELVSTPLPIDPEPTGEQPEKEQA